MSIVFGSNKGTDTKETYIGKFNKNTPIQGTFSKSPRTIRIALQTYSLQDLDIYKIAKDMFILFYCSNLQETRRRKRAYRNNIGAFTIVKRVTKKVLPIRGSIYQTDGSNLGRNKNQRKECLKREVALLPSTGPFNSKYITKKFSTLKRGTRLTPEQLVEIQLGIELTEREIELLYKLLYNREAVLTYDFIYLSRINPKIIPPQRI